MSGALVIASTWAGAPLAEALQARLQLDLEPAGLRVLIDAPFFDDPPPPADGQPRTARDGLWEHEVVELFIGAAEGGKARHYTELEFGPHGHALGLRFEGYRVRVARFEVAFEVLSLDRGARRWRGEARVPRALLPPPPWRMNAFAMHGDPRIHLAAFPAPEGLSPDFHAAAVWRPIDLTTSRA